MKFKVYHLVVYILLSVLSVLVSFIYYRLDLAVNFGLFIFHFVAGIYILYRIGGKLYVQDVRFVFLGAFLLYTIVLPLSVIYDSQTVLFSYSLDDVGVNGTLVLSTIGLIGFNCAMLKFQVPWRQKIPAKGTSTPKIYNPFPGIIYLLLIIGCLLIFILSKNIQLTITVENGRLATMSQTWVFLILLLNGAFLFFFSRYRNLGKMAKWIVIASFLFYVYLILIPLGGRRELMPVTFLLIFFLFENNKRSLRSSFLLILLALVFLAIGGIRELEKNDISVGNVFKYILVNNEFSIPARHTIAYLSNNNWTPLYGWSYVYFPIIFIPRDLLGGYKPLSLAWQTDLIFNISSGAAAFTPITEAYINFLWIGPFIVFFGLAYVFSYSILKIDRFKILYLILYIKVFDFNRGEFALWLYEIFFMVLSYYIVLILCNNNNFKKNVEINAE